MKRLSVKTAVKLTLTVLAFYAVVIVLGWAFMGDVGQATDLALPAVFGMMMPLVVGMLRR